MWYLKISSSIIIAVALICMIQNAISLDTKSAINKNQWTTLANTANKNHLKNIVFLCEKSLNSFTDQLEKTKSIARTKLSEKNKKTEDIVDLAMDIKTQVKTASKEIASVRNLVRRLAVRFRNTYKSAVEFTESENEPVNEELENIQNTIVDKSKPSVNHVIKSFSNRFDYNKLLNSALVTSLDNKLLKDNYDEKRKIAKKECSSLWNSLKKHVNFINDNAFNAMETFIRGIETVKSVKENVKKYGDDAINLMKKGDNITILKNAVELAKALQLIFVDEWKLDSGELYYSEEQKKKDDKKEEKKPDYSLEVNDKLLIDNDKTNNIQSEIPETVPELTNNSSDSINKNSPNEKIQQTPEIEEKNKIKIEPPQILEKIPDNTSNTSDSLNINSPNEETQSTPTIEENNIIEIKPPDLSEKIPKTTSNSSDSINKNSPIEETQSTPETEQNGNIKIEQHEIPENEGSLLDNSPNSINVNSPIENRQLNSKYDDNNILTKNNKNRGIRPLKRWEELIRQKNPQVSQESQSCINTLEKSNIEFDNIRTSAKQYIQKTKTYKDIENVEKIIVQQFYDKMMNMNRKLAESLINAADDICTTVTPIDEEYENKFRKDQNIKRIKYLLGNKYDPNQYILKVLEEANNKNGIGGMKKTSYFKMLSLTHNMKKEIKEMDDAALYAMNKIHEGKLSTFNMNKSINKERISKSCYIKNILMEKEEEEDKKNKDENKKKVDENLNEHNNESLYEPETKKELKNKLEEPEMKKSEEIRIPNTDEKYILTHHSNNDNPLKTDKIINEQQKNEAPEENNSSNNEQKPVKPENIENKLEEPKPNLNLDIGTENISDSQNRMLNDSAVYPSTQMGTNKPNSKSQKHDKNGSSEDDKRFKEQENEAPENENVSDNQSNHLNPENNINGLDDHKIDLEPKTTPENISNSHNDKLSDPALNLSNPNKSKKRRRNKTPRAKERKFEDDITFEEVEDDDPEDDNIPNNEPNLKVPENNEKELNDPKTALRPDISPENISNSQNEILGDPAVIPSSQKGTEKPRRKKTPHTKEVLSEDDITSKDQEDESISPIDQDANNSDNTELPRELPYEKPLLEKDSVMESPKLELNSPSDDKNVNRGIIDNHIQDPSDILSNNNGSNKPDSPDDDQTENTDNKPSNRKGRHKSKRPNADYDVEHEIDSYEENDVDENGTKNRKHHPKINTKADDFSTTISDSPPNKFIDNEKQSFNPTVDQQKNASEDSPNGVQQNEVRNDNILSPVESEEVQPLEHEKESGKTDVDELHNNVSESLPKNIVSGTNILSDSAVNPSIENEIKTPNSEYTPNANDGKYEEDKTFKEQENEAPENENISNNDPNRLKPENNINGLDDHKTDLEPKTTPEIISNSHNDKLSDPALNLSNPNKSKKRRRNKTPRAIERISEDDITFEEVEDDDPEDDNTPNNEPNLKVPENNEKELNDPKTVMRSDISPENISNSHNDKLSDPALNLSNPNKSKKRRINKTPHANDRSSEDDITSEDQEDESISPLDQDANNSDNTELPRELQYEKPLLEKDSVMESPKLEFNSPSDDKNVNSDIIDNHIQDPSDTLSNNNGSNKPGNPNDDQTENTDNKPSNRKGRHKSKRPNADYDVEHEIDSYEENDVDENGTKIRKHNPKINTKADDFSTMISDSPPNKFIDNEKQSINPTVDQQNNASEMSPELDDNESLDSIEGVQQYEVRNDNILSPVESEEVSSLEHENESGKIDVDELQNNVSESLPKNIVAGTNILSDSAVNPSIENDIKTPTSENKPNANDGKSDDDKTIKEQENEAPENENVSDNQSNHLNPENNINGLDDHKIDLEPKTTPENISNSHNDKLSDPALNLSNPNKSKKRRRNKTPRAKERKFEDDITFEEVEDDDPEDDNIPNNEPNLKVPENNEKELNDPKTALRPDISPENISNSQNEILGDPAVIPSSQKGTEKPRRKKTPHTKEVLSEDDITSKDQEDESISPIDQDANNSDNTELPRELPYEKPLLEKDSVMESPKLELNSPSDDKNVNRGIIDNHIQDPSDILSNNNGSNKPDSPDDDQTENTDNKPSNRKGRHKSKRPNADYDVEHEIDSYEENDVDENGTKNRKHHPKINTKADDFSTTISDSPPNKFIDNEKQSFNPTVDQQKNASEDSPNGVQQNEVRNDNILSPVESEEVQPLEHEKESGKTDVDELHNNVSESLPKNIVSGTNILSDSAVNPSIENEIKTPNSEYTPNANDGKYEEDKTFKEQENEAPENENISNNDPNRLKPENNINGLDDHKTDLEPKTTPEIISNSHNDKLSDPALNLSNPNKSKKRRRNKTPRAIERISEDDITFEEVEDDDPEDDNTPNNEPNLKVPENNEKELNDPKTVMRSDISPENISNSHNDKLSDPALNLSNPNKSKKRRINKTPHANDRSSEDDITSEDQEDESISPLDQDANNSDNTELPRELQYEKPLLEKDSVMESPKLEFNSPSDDKNVNSDIIDNHIQDPSDTLSNNNGSNKPGNPNDDQTENTDNKPSNRKGRHKSKRPNADYDVEHEIDSYEENDVDENGTKIRKHNPKINTKADDFSTMISDSPPNKFIDNEKQSINPTVDQQNNASEMSPELDDNESLDSIEGVQQYEVRNDNILSPVESEEVSSLEHENESGKIDVDELQNNVSESLPKNIVAGTNILSDSAVNPSIENDIKTPTSKNKPNANDGKSDDDKTIKEQENEAPENENVSDNQSNHLNPENNINGLDDHKIDLEPKTTPENISNSHNDKLSDPALNLSNPNKSKKRRRNKTPRAKERKFEDDITFEEVEDDDPEDDNIPNNEPNLKVPENNEKELNDPKTALRPDISPENISNSQNEILGDPAVIPSSQKGTEKPRRKKTPHTKEVLSEDDITSKDQEDESISPIDQDANNSDNTELPRELPYEKPLLEKDSVMESPKLELNSPSDDKNVNRGIIDNHIQDPSDILSNNNGSNKPDSPDDDQTENTDNKPSNRKGRHKSKRPNADYDVEHEIDSYEENNVDENGTKNRKHHPKINTKADDFSTTISDSPPNKFIDNEKQSFNPTVDQQKNASEDSPKGVQQNEVRNDNILSPVESEEVQPLEHEKESGKTDVDELHNNVSESLPKNIVSGTNILSDSAVNPSIENEIKTPNSEYTPNANDGKYEEDKTFKEQENEAPENENISNNDPNRLKPENNINGLDDHKTDLEPKTTPEIISNSHNDKLSDPALNLSNPNKSKKRRRNKTPRAIERISEDDITFEEVEDDDPEDDNTPNNEPNLKVPENNEKELNDPKTVMRSDISPENISNSHNDKLSDPALNLSNPNKSKKRRRNKTPSAKEGLSKDKMTFEEVEDDDLEDDDIPNNEPNLIIPENNEKEPNGPKTALRSDISPENISNSHNDKLSDPALNLSNPNMTKKRRRNKISRVKEGLSKDNMTIDEVEDEDLEDDDIPNNEPNLIIPESIDNELNDPKTDLESNTTPENITNSHNDKLSDPAVNLSDPNKTKRTRRIKTPHANDVSSDDDTMFDIQEDESPKDNNIENNEPKPYRPEFDAEFEDPRIDRSDIAPAYLSNSYNGIPSDSIVNPSISKDSSTDDTSPNDVQIDEMNDDSASEINPIQSYDDINYEDDGEKDENSTTITGMKPKRKKRILREKTTATNKKKTIIEEDTPDDSDKENYENYDHVPEKIEEHPKDRIRKPRQKKRIRRVRTYMVNKLTNERIPIDDQRYLTTDRLPNNVNKYTNEIPYNKYKKRNIDESEPMGKDNGDYSSFLFKDYNSDQCKRDAYDKFVNVESQDAKQIAYRGVIDTSIMRRSIISTIDRATSNVMAARSFNGIDQCIKEVSYTLKYHLKNTLGNLLNKVIPLANGILKTTEYLQESYQNGRRSTYEMLTSILFDEPTVPMLAKDTLKLISPEFDIDSLINTILNTSSETLSMKQKKANAHAILTNLSKHMDLAISNIDCFILSTMSTIGSGQDTLKFLETRRVSMTDQDPRAKELRDAVGIIRSGKNIQNNINLHPYNS